MSDGDSLKDFLYEVGFISDPSGAAKVNALAKDTEAKLSATAEAGAAKRVAIEEAAGTKTKSAVDRYLDERAAAEDASLARRKAASRCKDWTCRGAQNFGSARCTGPHPVYAGQSAVKD